MTLAPIALFAYNRPDHLRRTVESLLSNPLVGQSDLYIFSDGAKSAADESSVEAVRTYLHNLTGLPSLHVVERARNAGLARSIIEGVSELCASHGKVVVLEDDLVLAPGYLDFINRGLDRYAHEPRIMQISGYMFPVDRPEELADAFFCRLPTSWGWATWKRAWNCFEIDGQKLLDWLQRSERQREFDINGSYPYTETLAAQAQGRMDVWGVRWYASMFQNDGLCLYPSRSLIANQGMDGSGVHCGVSSAFDVRLSQSVSWSFPDEVKESQLGIHKIESFFRLLQDGARGGVLRRILSRTQRSARNFTKAWR
jgi:hypothetical protein